MLMAVNWAELVQGTAMPPVVLPELTGIGGLEAAQSATAVDTSPSSATTAASTPADSTLASRGDSEGSTRPTMRSASTQEDLQTGPAGADASAGTTEPHLAPTPFSKRLLLGISGGALAALVIVAMATFCMRRTF